MIRLVALDLDGTLLNRNGEISDETKRTIQQVRSKGVKIVLCTGRPFYSLQPLIEQLELTGSQEFVISFNGALISDTQGKEISFEQALSYEDYLSIKQLSEQLQLSYHVQSRDGIYTSNTVIDPATAYDSHLNQTAIHCVSKEYFQHIPIYKMMFVGNSEQLDKVIPKIPKSFKEQFNLMRSLDCFYEFLHPRASKGRALKFLAKQFGMQPAEVLAIGDNENDLSMLSFAGISVAMGNAHEQIKQKVDYVTKTNEENGVQHSLQQLINVLEAG